MYDLNRFLSAQRRDYAAALREIRSGRKRSHWIWYIFPQVAGLGMSSTSQFYAISGLDEARAYLSEPTLRAHLLEISSALLALEESDPTAVFGFPDEAATKPRARSSSVRARILFIAPRSLNAPVRCIHSALAYTSQPRASSSAGRRSSGV